MRLEALRSLATMGGNELQEAIQFGLNDTVEAVRNEARAIQARLNPTDAFASLEKVLEHGTTSEKQKAFASLASIRDERADKVLTPWLDKVIAKTVPEELTLDILESAGKRTSEDIQEKLKAFEANRTNAAPLEKYREALVGGDAAQGRVIFFERAEASCLRCHKVGNEGGEVGPQLDGIAAKRDRAYL